MAKHPRAGQLAHQSDLINVAQLVTQYYALHPNIEDVTQRVVFGTSGHRGSSARLSFNEDHISAIAQAIAETRARHGIEGPCLVGKDTHALSEPALISVLEVLTANGIDVFIQADNGFTPTPAISHAILAYNRQHTALADGIIITPSHNPPEDGGIKYNFSHGGPADTLLTDQIEQRANALLATGLKGVKRNTLAQAQRSGHIHRVDWVQPYVDGLVNVVNMPRIQQANMVLGVHPLGGAGIAYWQRIAEHYQLNLSLINDDLDPTFRFMHLDHDGVIRMDCSSEDAMQGLLTLRSQFDLAFANDPDHDRHGIVTPQGLMKPNHYLAVVTDYLFQHRPRWQQKIAVGKTLVSSSLIDRIVQSLGHQLLEMPVGFKWFVEGLYAGKLGFACEESAGASFLDMHGQPWSTDKDGIIMCLLAAELTAITGNDPYMNYTRLVARFGSPYYSRIQAPATHAQKSILAKLSAEQVTATTLADEPIIQRLTTAPGNGEAIGGLKIITENGWFAARPSGTEDSYKIYCESFISEHHLNGIEQEAIQIVNQVLKQAES